MGYSPLFLAPPCEWGKGLWPNEKEEAPARGLAVPEISRETSVDKERQYAFVWRISHVTRLDPQRVMVQIRDVADADACRRPRSIS